MKGVVVVVEERAGCVCVCWGAGRGALWREKLYSVLFFEDSSCCPERSTEMWLPPPPPPL